MSLATGSRIGAYEIVGLLGTGGMGEVYRARDATLNREVAIKVLLAAVANDPDRLARFKREAQVLASLNHPNIAHVHGFEDAPPSAGQTGVRALVMELVEGPTLAERIARGPIPLDEALPIAKQIAEALESAHAHGIIHRDLKPANVKVRPDGTVKVLDFGLAKALDPLGPDEYVAGSPPISPTQSPTITSPALTLRGVILGTAAYMSPEQAKGRPTDTRTDIWAFGCVLFEMLTGGRAFRGDDVADTMVAVLSKEPDWQWLPADAVAVRPLLARCLKKGPRQRLQAIGDARIEIEDLMSGTSLPVAQPIVTHWRSRSIAWVAAAALATAALGALATWGLTRAAPTAVTASLIRFELVPSAAHPLEIYDADRNIAVSPDGRQIAYRGGGSLSQLVVRSLDRLDARPLEGVVSARSPFFSADGQWIGFFDGRHLKKISTAGGSAISIAEETRLPRGGSWGEDNRIVYATYESGLIAVSANGGESRALTTLSPDSGERSHWHPFLLPGDRGVLYTIAVPNQSQEAGLAVLDFRTGQQKTLLRPGTQAAYAPTGHLIYVAGSTLMAVRFDLDRLETYGDPMPLVDGVRISAGGTADYVLSRTGTLVYVPAAVTDAPRSLAWLDRQGRESPINAPPRSYGQPRLSPDGGRVALVVRDRQSDIAVWDLARETLMPLTLTSGNEQKAVWTPDGKRLVFASEEGRVIDLYARAADGTGTVERLTSGVQDPLPAFVSPDGTGILGTRTSPEGAGDVVWFPLPTKGAPPSGPSQVKPLVSTPFVEYQPDVSPNRRYMAYQSNESGRTEIYVEPFAQRGGGKWRVSTQGGTMPVWARNGRELFYVDAANMLMAVPVDTSSEALTFGAPSRLFEMKIPQTAGARDYDVSADGRFLTLTPGDRVTASASMQRMVVVLNWLEELKAKLPTERAQRAQ